MIDHYLSISDPTEGLYKEKASKFFSYSYPVKTMEEVQERLSTLKKAHPKARHFCYAFYMKPDKSHFRANDDGEPSGTAGKPILGQLEKYGVTNTLIVVVRYFGGTKLGASGLIRAYKEAAKEALLKANIIEEFIEDTLLVTTSFESVGTAMNIVSNIGYPIKNIEYSEVVKIYLTIRQSDTTKVISKLKAKFLNRDVMDVDETTKVDQVSFEVL